MSNRSERHPGPRMLDAMPSADTTPTEPEQARARNSPPAAAQPELLAMLQSVWRDLPGLVGDRIDLLSLELQRAGRALAQIVALLVAAAILGVTAWLALWAGIGVGLVELGLHWLLALLLVLLLNGAVAALALARLRRLLPLLRLPATRRHLVPGQGGDPPPAR